MYVDVGEPTSHPCSMTGMIQGHHLPALQDFESLGTSMSGICMTSRSSTERIGNFSESVVFHVVSWVSFGLFWFGFGWVVVCCFCVCVVLKTPSFLLSPILQHVGIANQRQNVLMTV